MKEEKWMKKEGRKTGLCMKKYGQVQNWMGNEGR